MGLATERHDLVSQETHAGRWISFRQPVQRVAREREGETFQWTYEANPGEVWEEDEFWIALSWAIDEDGSLGIRKHFESPYRPGERVTVEEQYRWIFENSVPGLPEAAAEEGLTPLAYMRRHGAFEVAREVYEPYVEAREGKPAGFHTPSGKLEFYSQTMVDWGFADQALPGYIQSHVHPSRIDPQENEFVLVPIFRLPTLIHTRSANAKWLCELSNANPLWIHTSDARRVGVEAGDLVRVATRIGHVVNRVWVTEGIRPGVVACSHHLGRWRVGDRPGTDRWASYPVTLEQDDSGVCRIRRTGDVAPFDSGDPDSGRVFWTDGGVHQNLTFPAQPDPISGMNCWHHKVTVTRAEPGDRYGDIEVDTRRSMEAYREWLALALPADRETPDNLRRPLWLSRAVRPSDKAYRR
jgi:anaerobic selenocysteine-containing dehydrogenase